MADEVKNVIESLNRAFHEFKTENAKGRDADKNVLANIQAELAKYDGANQAIVAKLDAERKAMAEQIEQLEAKLNRGGVAAGSAVEQKAAERKETFLAFGRYGMPRDASVEHKWAGLREEKGLKLEAKAMTVADDTSGGFLAPPDYVKEIIKASVLMSPMRDLVKVRLTGLRSIQQPKRTQTAGAQWVGESQTRTETQNPAYGLVEIPTHEMVAVAYVSFADLEDSVFDLAGELTTEFSEQFGVSEGASIVVGNGVSKPFGITDPSQGLPTTGTGGATLTGDSIVTMFHAVDTAYANNGRFILNRQTLGSVRLLKDSQGRYIWEPSVAAGMPSTLLGAPYTEVPDMPAVAANATPIGFGDWKRAYTVADRLSISMVRDGLTRADQGQVKFIARRRVGGQVVLAKAARLLKCA